jgi:translation initiation factor 5A
MTIKGFPCKVTSVSTSKTGKHGSAKCNFTAIDIFNGKKYEDIQPSTAVVPIPFVKKIEYSLVDINEDGFCSLMSGEGEVREDVKLPEFPDNFGREIKQAFDAGRSLIVILQSAMGVDQIIAMKDEADPKDTK